MGSKGMRTPSKFIILAFLNLSFLSATYAGSTIYKYVDQDGNITFTNRPVKGGQKIKTSSQRQSQSSGSKTYSSRTIRHFPKETADTQNKRDIRRREILEHELATEMKLFSDTRKNLSVFQGKDVGHQQNENFKQLQNKLLRHENNITALKKELTRL